MTVIFSVIEKFVNRRVVNAGLDAPVPQELHEGLPGNAFVQHHGENVVIWDMEVFRKRDPDLIHKRE